jgi:uncharacterized YccA/Bax inhibitor family protein
MSQAPLEELLRSSEAKRFPPPLSNFEWVCHLACIGMLICGLIDILTNLSDFRAVQQSAQPVPNAPESVLWTLYGSAVGLYLMIAAFTPFPKLYNYPFRLKPGEERVVFQPTRSFANLLAAQSVLMLVLINHDMIRVVAQGRPSILAWVIGALLTVMGATIVHLFWRLLRLHAQYLPPVADGESPPA